MSTLDEIAARDAEWPEGGFRAMEADEDGLMFAVNDRRYLLGLVREAREALWAACDCPRHGDSTSPLRKVPEGHQPYCNCVREPIASLIQRRTEGSDRT